MKKLLLALALFCTAALIYADRITLADGSVVNGTVKNVQGGKVVIATAFAGDITVSMDKVVKLSTTESVQVATNNGTKLSGVLNDTTIGQTPLALTDMKYLWRDGSEDPTLPPKRKWNGEVYADISGKTGNTERFTGGAGFNANLVGPIDRFSLYGNVSYNRENHVTNTKKYLAGADYERKIENTNNTWYAKLEFEKQPTSGLRLRSELSAGYGYYFISEPRTRLRGRVGLNGKTRKYTDGTHGDGMGMEFNLRFEQDIQAWGKWVTDLTWQPTFDTIHDYRILHESSLDIPMLLSMPLTLRIGMQNEYNSRVPSGAERMDTTYFAKIVYKWK